MPICKICNKPVSTGIVLHTECFENKPVTNFEKLRAELTIEKMTEFICNSEENCLYCVFVREGDTTENDFGCKPSHCCKTGTRQYLEREI